MAAAHNLRACWSHPIPDADRRVLGTFALYYHEPRTPTQSELDLIKQSVHLAAVAIQRMQTIGALRESEAQIRLLLDSTAEAIYGVDPSGRCTFANQACAAVLGYDSVEDLLGRNMHDLIHHTRADGTAYPESECRIFQAYRENRGSQVDDEVIWRKDGTSFPAEYWSYPIRRNGEVLGSVVTFLDISERVRARRELETLNRELELRVEARTLELAVAKDRAEAADRLKSSFLATMSHELRTPLNSIIGFSGILVQEMVGPMTDEQKKQLGMVRTSANHLLSLINDVLDISKIEAGQLEVHMGRFDLRACVTHAVTMIRPLADKKGLALTSAIASEVGSIMSDQRRVEQVLMNLLSNAVKFTEKGSVSIETVIEGGLVVTRVADTSPGIKPGDLEKLFRPFTQVDSGLARQHEGTGLGLAISRKLVEKLGGEIHVESTWGEGSTFWFTLPLGRPG